MKCLKFVPVLVLAIAGCGGGGTGVTRQGPSGTEFPVVTGDSAPAVAVPAGSQGIIGSQAISLFSIREIQLQKTNGAEKANGAVTIADGTSLFTGASGYSGSGIQAGNIGQLALIPTNQTYTTATMYSGGIADPSNNIFYGITQGVYGAATPAGAITTNGTATYNGDAAGIFKDTSLIKFNAGNSTVNVDFQSQTANVSMFAFDPNSAPFDEVMVTGMSINGNRFDGGTLQLSKGGIFVQGLGPSTASTATGAFFGAVNGAGIPDEVGGQVYARGDTGAFVGTFVAK